MLLPASSAPLLSLQLINIFSFQTSAKKNGILHAPIQLIQGDFLTNLAVRDAVMTSGVVFMNNPKFGAELNLKVLGTLCPLMPKDSLLVCFDWEGLDQWDNLQMKTSIHISPGMCDVRCAMSWSKRCVPSAV